MSKRAALITKSDASRLFQAAKAAGYDRARLVSHPDGRIELLAETLREGESSDAGGNEWDEVLTR
ncbi:MULTISPECIES: hypothetical protein [unclassified Mesorhizobium]|uniref:hypothetical protein n=1 Tax=unclassified Mesorhizobium TaxID=325217 RepID=UPI000FCC5031|nr:MULTISPECIES: hypothetical protein [unclassified Mesorhizobium]TGP24996.1 hypothetical protein EN874_007730 [Mesorhizobium sp. M1D.F.Ca.ET.231.01.1.1]TGP36320.1 hypothetical protein EN877_07730 [Mesorhizobium sp. M1D.F.Ca.ET.234.01.1.1]TGS49823.1 hypothetical protein EN827_07730 [Mesorhizobium sp. M1D.F.Ca.ET.184.01.1.1]TGS64534.1 hypothetical protein EN826_007730 [Mesorhizobium sp. M1D.F.Ca.ET.183.01.1.1]